MNSFQKCLVLLRQPIKLLRALSDLFMPGFVFLQSMYGIPGVGDGQGGLAYCDSRGRKESDMTERLN